jgi:hypothetical protein
MSNLRETLCERNSKYGGYNVGTKLRADIMDLINQSHVYHHRKEMPAFWYIAILDIVNKLTRLAVTPDHLDSWHDIQGYAKLVEGHIRDLECLRANEEGEANE